MWQKNPDNSSCWCCMDYHVYLSFLEEKIWMTITLLSSSMGHGNYICFQLNAYPILCWSETSRGGEVHSWVAKIYPEVETNLSGCCYPQVHLPSYLCYLWLHPGKFNRHILLFEEIIIITNIPFTFSQGVKGSEPQVEIWKTGSWRRDRNTYLG